MLRLVSLRLEMFAMFIFLLLLGFASAQYPQWSTISWNGKTAKIIRAVGPDNDMNGTIDCTRYYPGECEITLNITHMLTMTLYDYIPELLNKSGGHRGVDGYAIKINDNGSFAFRYARPDREIKTFLWPIIADAHTNNDILGRRSVIAVNNQVPGPTIIARKGQILNIKVANNLASESISIHWHGQHVNGTPWMDGVAHITQCPIVPYTEFTYSFTPDQVGTHWYHAHSGAQRTDGLFGALIIKSDGEFNGTDLENITKMDTYKDRPEEHTISLIDWQHDNSIDLFTVIHSSSRFQNPINESEMYNNTKIYDGSESAPYPFLSGLINGLGWEFTPVNSSSCNHKNNPLSFFNVAPGEAYRFRLIGAQNAYAFRFSIQDHKLELLATDGMLVKTDPEKVDFIIIHSGERYDFLLNTTGKSSDNYWIVAETLETQDDLVRKRYHCTRGRRAYAILHYTDASYDRWPRSSNYNPTSHCTSSSKCYAANCPFQNFPEKYNIMCLNVGSFKQRHYMPTQMFEIGDNDKSLFLNFGFGGDIDGSSINGRHFLFPPNPPTTQYSNLPEDYQNNGSKVCTYSQESNEYEGKERRCLHVYKLKDEIVQNKGTVEIVFMNLLNLSRGINFGQAHPVHLHGHHFQVIHIEYGNCNETEGTCHHPDITCPESHCDINVSWNKSRPNYGNGTQEPAEKDTVIVPVGGYVVIRFRADNPGWWFLHCHIEPHQLEGMSMVVREGTPPPSPDSFPKCGNFEIAKPKSASSTSQAVELAVLIPLLLVWYAL